MSFSFHNTLKHNCSRAFRLKGFMCPVEFAYLQLVYPNVKLVTGDGKMFIMVNNNITVV
jgi:hypothetical protein